MDRDLVIHFQVVDYVPWSNMQFFGDAVGLWMMVPGDFEITVIYTLSLTLDRYIPAEIEIEAADVLWRKYLLYLMMYLSESYHVP